MKYIAPVEADDPATRLTSAPEGDGLGLGDGRACGCPARPWSGRVGSMARTVHRPRGGGDRVWVLSARSLVRRTRDRSWRPTTLGTAAWRLRRRPRASTGSDSRDLPEADDRPVIVTAPAEGATVTGGIAVTGGVVVVDATARRALGTVHASVSIGDAVLGCHDVSVDLAGPFEVRIPVFPPAFDAPVVLRLDSEPLGGRSGFAVSRQLRLDVPSVVGFWDAAPTAADRQDRPSRVVDPRIRATVRADGRHRRSRTGGAWWSRSRRSRSSTRMPAPARSVGGSSALEASLPDYGCRPVRQVPGSSGRSWRDAATGVSVACRDVTGPEPDRELTACRAADERSPSVREVERIPLSAYPLT